MREVTDTQMRLLQALADGEDGKLHFLDESWGPRSTEFEGFFRTMNLSGGRFTARTAEALDRRGLAVFRWGWRDGPCAKITEAGRLLLRGNA